MSCGVCAAAAAGRIPTAQASKAARHNRIGMRDMSMLSVMSREV